MPELPEVETIKNEVPVSVKIDTRLGKNWSGVGQSNRIPNPNIQSPV